MSVEPTSLTEPEQLLVEHVIRGDGLDLAGDGAVDDTAMRSWGGDRTVRAAVIRDILRGRHAPDPDPHGVRLRGARIAGRLDLDRVTSSVSVDLAHCLLEEGVDASDARLPGLALTGCRLEHPSLPPLDARRLAASWLALGGAWIAGSCETGAVELLNARIGGSLSCTGANLRNESGPALVAEGLQVDATVFLDGFTAVGIGDAGVVNLVGARIGGQLVCSGASLRNESGQALVADGLQVSHDVILRDGFTAVGVGNAGAVRLVGARIGGQLVCSGASLRNESGPALEAIRLRVDGDVALSDGFTAVGAGDLGAVLLLNAQLGGGLSCSGAILRNESGPALDGGGLQAGRRVVLFHGSELVGAGDAGAVRLPNARLGGGLSCYASLRNESGPALVAFGLQSDEGVDMGDGFEAVGAGDGAAVQLFGARIGGDLSCMRACLRNESGPALDAGGMEVDRGVFLGGGFEAIGAGSDVTIDLSKVRIGGVLGFYPARLENTSDARARLDLERLVYSGLPDASVDWLGLIRDATPSYAAQPYQQLAAAHRAAGHDADARRVVMAQRRDQVHRGALTGRAERAWARLTGVTLGYGYQPWRALVALLLVVVLAVTLAVAAGARGGLTRTDQQSLAPVNCSTIDQVGVGLDFGLPLINTGARDRCDTTDSPAGQALTAASWGLQLLAWAFATLFVAGFTGAVRKT